MEHFEVKAKSNLRIITYSKLKVISGTLLHFLCL